MRNICDLLKIEAAAEALELLFEGSLDHNAPKTEANCRQIAGRMLAGEILSLAMAIRERLDDGEMAREERPSSNRRSAQRVAGLRSANRNF